jgi:hypothetical protein
MKAFRKRRKRPTVARQCGKTSAEPPALEDAPKGTGLPAKGQLGKVKVAADDLDAVLSRHTPLVGQSVYRQMLKCIREDNGLDRTALTYICDAMTEMKCNDPFEQMLVMQAIWTHTRLAHLSALANQQTDSDHIKVLNEACDRCANTFRRQMLGIAEYRRPPRTDAFVAIKQANVAQQQVIANGENQNSTKAIASNELGSAKMLPAVAERVEFPSGVGLSQQAVAVEHRPEDEDGQGSRQDERDEARRA